MAFAFNVDVSQIGMDEMREYPELGSFYRLCTAEDDILTCA